MVKPAYIVAGIIVIVAIVAVAFVANNHSSVSQQAASSGSSSQNAATVPILLTDPPVVPSGTASLVINYSGEQVHLANAGNASGWVNATGSGSINLLSEVNLSQTIGDVSLPAGATINMARFDIVSAQITINGTTYNVTVPSGKVTAHITSGQQVNGSASILLDLSPTVVTIVTNTSAVYVLVPSVRAVLAPSAALTVTSNGHASISADVRARLDDAAPNISITNASITVSGANSTQISLTVKDNSNQSITLRHVNVFGNVSMHFNSTALAAHIDSIVNSTNAELETECTNISASATTSQNNGGNTIRGNASTDASANYIPSQPRNHDNYNTLGVTGKLNVSADASGSNNSLSSGEDAGFNASAFDAHFHLNGTIHINGFEGADDLKVTNGICNASWLANVSARIRQAQVMASDRIQSQLMYSSHRTAFALLVNSSGSLSSPSSEQDLNYSNGGLTLQPGQSATLSFSGSLAHESHDGFFSASLVSGDSYRVMIMGTQDAFASVNVTAK